MLLLSIQPNVRRQVIIYLLFHDFGERWVGDLPCTAGWANEDLRVAYKSAQEHALESAGIPIRNLRNALTQAELWLVEQVDKLELLYWASEQPVPLGQEVMENLRNWFKKHEKQLDPEIRHLVTEVCDAGEA
jgi:5'-deoxynucleotidase YfbR-like HD superfamily hydrolase